MNQTSRRSKGKRKILKAKDCLATMKEKENDALIPCKRMKFLETKNEVSGRERKFSLIHKMKNEKCTNN